MSNILVLNQPYVNVGLDTMTYTVATTGVYNIQVQATFPSAAATGFGAGTAVDQGLGVTGGTQGIGQGSNLSLGNGGTGLGFGGSTTDGALGGNGSGHGAGAGGGAEGFTGGDLGAGHGGVGQGFGAANGYQQPPANVITPTSGVAVSSSLVVTVNQNGSPIYTFSNSVPTQSAIQFKSSFVGTAADVITVVLSSSNASDKLLNSVQSIVSIGQGQ